MKQAIYERRPTKQAEWSARLAFIVASPFMFYLAFFAYPPTGWWHDGPFDASIPWFIEHWAELYYANFTPAPGLFILGSHMSAALSPVAIMWTQYGLVVPYCVHIVSVAAGGFTVYFCAFFYHLSGIDPVDIRTHVAGLQLLRGPEAIESAKAAGAKEIKRVGKGLGLSPTVELSKLQELRNLLILGATGSGKTRLMLFYIEQILRRVTSGESEQTRVLIHDTTGEIFNGLPLQAKEFAILHGHKAGGWAWAMGRDIVSEDDAEAVGLALAPHSSEGVWREGSATILAGCLVLCQYRFGAEWGAADFYDALLTDPIDLKEKFEKAYKPAALLIQVDGEGNLSRTTTSFFLSFRGAVLRFMRPLAKNWGGAPFYRQFSFIAWLEGSRRQPSVVLLQRSGKYPELSASWIGAAVDTIAAHACDESFPNSQKRRVFLCLDELAALKRLQRLPDLLDVGRNKGVAVIAALQELEQLEEHYGKNLATSFLKRFRLKIIAQQNQDQATEDLSRRLIGTRTARVGQKSSAETTTSEGTSRSSTTSDQDIEVPIVRPDYLAYGLGVTREKVSAIVVGLGDVVQLEWPVTIWNPRRGQSASD